MIKASRSPINQLDNVVNLFTSGKTDPLTISNSNGLLEATLKKEYFKHKSINSVQMADTLKSYREYEDICALMVDIWVDFPNNEVQGFITSNGKMIVTAIGDKWAVSGPKPILFNDQYYLAWDKQQDLTSSHKGSIDYSSSDHVFIPIKAMFHTHVISGSLSQKDQWVAQKFNKMKHLLFEHNRISEFDERGIRKVYKANIVQLCELIQN